MRTQQPRPTGRASEIMRAFANECRDSDIRADNVELRNRLDAAFREIEEHRDALRRICWPESEPATPSKPEPAPAAAVTGASEPTQEDMERALYAAHWYRCDNPWEECWHQGPFEGRVIGTERAYRWMGKVREEKEHELRAAGWVVVQKESWYHPAHVCHLGYLDLDAAHAKLKGGAV